MTDLRLLLADQAQIAELTPAEAAAALAELASVQAALTKRLEAMTATSATEREQPPADRLMTAEDVAAKLQRSVDWVYRQAKHWPFTRRLTRRTVRFSESGLLRWLAQRGVNSDRRGAMVGVSAPTQKGSHAR